MTVKTIIIHKLNHRSNDGWKKASANAASAADNNSDAIKGNKFFEETENNWRRTDSIKLLFFTSP